MAAGPAGRRATVRLGLRCNNNCVFCAQDGLAPRPEAGLDAALRAARTTSDALTFVGGEPTLDDDLPGKVARARDLGFERIGIQTNGAGLVRPAFVASLVRAGLTDVHLSLHGAEAAVHDYHTERSGSFDVVLTAIHAARDARLPVVVTTVLTRSSFRVIGAMPRLLSESEVAGWFVSIPAIAGRAAALRDRVVPRLGLAVPFALQALAAAHARKLAAFVVGAPVCLLGPFAVNAVATAVQAYAAVCDGCPARPVCPGVDPAYLARFEGDELAPRNVRAVPPIATPLTAMFVGPGELSPGSATQPHLAPSAARPRTSLPLLGKVRPGVAEASSKTERRTGDALKEIFPSLFEPAAQKSPADDEPTR